TKTFFSCSLYVFTVNVAISLYLSLSKTNLGKNRMIPKPVRVRSHRRLTFIFADKPTFSKFAGNQRLFAHEAFPLVDRVTGRDGLPLAQRRKGNPYTAQHRRYLYGRPGLWRRRRVRRHRTEDPQHR